MDDHPDDALLARLREALRPVQDPEIGESIVDLGLVERLAVRPGEVDCVLVPTSATCPMADQIIDDTRAALQAACPAGWSVEVDMDWDIEWTPQRLAPALKLRFGW